MFKYNKQNEFTLQVFLIHCVKNFLNALNFCDKILSESKSRVWKMAILKVLTYGDKILRTPSKEVHKVSKKINNLVKDMLATMYAYNGVGLAAPQVGENLRIFVIDVSPENGPKDPRVFINPRIIKKSGAMMSNEGCLSFPEAYMPVKRYSSVSVKAINLNGKPFMLESTGDNLLTRAIQHEFDHLEGILFVDHAKSRFEADAILAEKGLPPVDPDFLLDEKELEKQIAQSSTQQENIEK